MTEDTPKLAFCRRCKKCCTASGSKIVLSKHDIRRLRDAGLTFKVRKDYRLSKMVMENGKCKFLGPEGCVLPEKVRPLDCKTYPVHFIPDGKNRYYLTIALDCPFWNKIPQSYIDYVTREAQKDFAHWSHEEQIGYWV